MLAGPILKRDALNAQERLGARCGHSVTRLQIDPGEEQIRDAARAILE
jgi:hypothetical protein